MNDSTMFNPRIILKYLFLILLAAEASPLPAAETTEWTSKTIIEGLAATKQPMASKATVLGVVSAGERLVAVGDHGVILLSEPGDEAFRQAQHVPTRTTLTAVHFVDDKRGWAVGHQGVVLTTGDGGENWSLLRSGITEEPLFTVWFENPQRGFVGGRFATLLETTDGGNTWAKRNITREDDEVERNLFHIFSGADGRIYIAAEKGTVYVTENNGAQWEPVETGYGGSFWAGIVLSDGTVIVVGMRGSIYRSTDQGTTWGRVELDLKASLTDVIQLQSSNVLAVGMDGAIVESADGGKSFTLKEHPERLSFTAVVERTKGNYQLFGKSGVVGWKYR